MAHRHLPACRRRVLGGPPDPRQRPQPSRYSRRPTAVAALHLALAFAVACVGLAPATSAAAPPADEPVRHRPPVDAPVLDPFRAPPHPYGAGNRGLDYGTAPGTAVTATAAGRVVFAGQVAATRHVTVLHADGLRTSYSFLATVHVQAGQRVEQGDPIGTSAGRFHLGVRDASGTYLDPAVLFAGEGGRRAHLVPGADEGVDPLVERRALLSVLFDEVVGLGDERARLLLHYARELSPATRVAHLAGVLRRWRADQAGCTPVGTAPPRPAGRRIAVLVAGLGSTSDQAGIDGVDQRTLGYAPGDVLRFSYRGGRIPAELTPALRALPARPYGAPDSQGDLRQAAARLVELVAAVARVEPGVPIDVIAHSQGGVVARLALAAADRARSRPAEWATLVTLGTPHDGADLATALDASTRLGGAGAVLGQAQGVFGLELDPASTAVSQLSEVSDLADQVRTSPIPEPVRFVSVAASGDLVVPSPRTVVPGHASAVVPLTGAGAHDRLPGSPAATREIALAIGGAGPTCRSAGDALGAALVGEAISWHADLLGAGAVAAGAARPGAVVLAPPGAGP